MSKISLTFFFIFITVLLNSQIKKEEPSWFYLKKAENFKEQKDYATALTMARKAKQVHIQEKLDIYSEEMLKTHREKTE